MPVYFIQADNGGLVKIGKAVDHKNLMQRFARARKFIGCPITILGIIDGYTEEEEIILSHFSEFRVRGDWLEPVEPLLDFIRANAKPFHRKRNGPISERFWKKVNKDGPTMPHMTTPCWVWMGYTDRKGYGRFSLTADKSTPAHRFSYELHNGPIPIGMFSCHHCDNPPCCRPDHLFAGTQLDNEADKAAKGRQPKGERNGSHTHPERRARGERSGARTHPEKIPRGESHWTRVSPEKIQSMPRGERHYKTKFTDADIIEIRIRHSQGGITIKQIADERGAERATISKIIHRKNWKHI